MDINKTDIRYTLTTSDGCGGSGLISNPDSFAWGHGLEGEGETVSVLFEQIEEDGTVWDTCEIDGDDWRTLEDSGELEKVLTWVNRGCALESAVEAAVQEVDPEGFDSDYEDRIDDLTYEANELRAMLASLLPYANSRIEDIGASETAEAFKPDADVGSVAQRARDLIERARVLAERATAQAQAAATIAERINAAKLVDMTADPSVIDDDTGAPVMRPVHLIVGDTAYWLEPAFPLQGFNVDVLMGAPLADGGAVCWDDEREIAEADCADFDAIRERLEPYTPAKRV